MTDYYAISGQMMLASIVLISGDQLPHTGAYLYERDLDISGALQAQITSSVGSVIKVTGSAPIAIADLTGIGGAIVFMSGGQVFISGGAGGGGGATGDAVTQAQLDSLSGYSASVVNLASTGSYLYNTIIGESGSNLNTYATIVNLGLTGSNLYRIITGASGQALGDYATKTSLTNTGVIIEGQINSLSGWAASSVNLTNTGVSLLSTIASTGNQAWNAANNNGINLSGRLGVTGSNLYNLITGLSGQNSNDYATKSSLAATGSNLYILTTGLSGNFNSIIANTGQAAWLAADNNARNLSGNLTQTGIILNAKIDNLSGYDSSTYATIINLTSTGISLGAQINALSGFTIGASGALQSQITAGGGTLVKITGSSTLPIADFTGIGGLLVFSSGGQVFISGGSAAGGGVTQGQLDSLSGWAASAVNLYSTGSYLYNLATGLSGSFNNSFATITNLALTGSNLYNIITGASGQFSNDFATKTQLTNTGVILEGQINSLSGYATSAINLTQTGISLLGIIANTGQQSWTAANNNSINLSGNLTQSGVVIESQINSLSGFTIGASGALQSQITAGAGSQVKITGSTSIPIADFTGIGGVVIFTSGNQIFISGGAGNGVVTQAQLDSLSGWSASAVNLGLTGSNLYILVTGLSGQSVNTYATIANLALTGSNLYTTVTGLSGAFNTNIASTGSQSWNAANNNSINLSGNLMQTGIALNTKIDSLSGYGSSVYATISNLTQTGVIIENQINSLSGFTIGASGALQAQIIAGATVVKVTGSSAIPTADFTGISGITVLTSGAQIFISSNHVTQNQLDSLSGYSASAVNLTQTGATLLSVIATTGQAAWLAANNNSINLSGNLTTTGQTLYNLITNASGGFATTANLALTGSNLYNLITGTSGQAFIDYATKSSLALTGSNLYILTTGLSGSFNNVVALTGQQAWNAANNNGLNLSGNLTTTGQTLYNLLTNASGTFASASNLALTGSNLYVLVTGLSGQANTNYASVTNLALTGSNLYINLTGLSGSFNAQIASTGSQAWNAANNNGINLSGNLTTTGVNLLNIIYGGDTNLSGNLTQTGVTLLTKITSLSGFTIGVSGALQALIAGGGSAVKITGSSSLTTADFTGIGGTLVFSSGSQVFISGGAGGGGVSQGQLDSLSGFVVTNYTMIGITQALWQTNYSP